MQYDVVVVLGGGVRAGGEVPPWVKARFDRALEIGGDAPILCLSAGTVHRPNPMDESGRPIFEAVAGARYLLRRGVPAERILVETCSWETIGNAYFARTCHIDVRGWRRMLVITSESHMPRSEAIFRWVFGCAPGPEYDMTFEATADAGLSAEALAARVERERSSLGLVRKLTERIHSMAELHRFLFTEHLVYRASLEPPAPATGAVADAY